MVNLPLKYLYFTTIYVFFTVISFALSLIFYNNVVVPPHAWDDDNMITTKRD